MHRLLLPLLGDLCRAAFGSSVIRNTCFPLFLLLWVTSTGYIAAYAATPTITSVSPVNVSGLTGVAKTVTAVYSDADGATNITESRLSVSSSSALSVSLVGRYQGGLLYLANDAGNGWIGGYAPGSANTITNSQGSLSCAATTVSSAGNDLTINWRLTPSSTYTGSKNLYATVVDATPTTVGPLDMGDWVISTSNVTPQIVSVSPTNVTSLGGQARAITTVCSDANGVADIAESRLIIGSGYGPVGSLYVNYSGGVLWLRSDDGNSWLGGFAPGSANTITNSQGSLNCAATTVTASGNTLTVYWNLTAASTYPGNQNIYAWVIDRTPTAHGPLDMGDWVISTTTPTPPTNVSVSPATSTSSATVAKTISAVYSDANGAADIKQARLLVNTVIAGPNSLYVLYDQDTNKLWMAPDAGTGLLGGYAPGTSNVISNSQGSLNCAQTTVSAVGNNLTVNWNFTPSSAFTGTKNIYQDSTDFFPSQPGWQDKGDWTIGALPFNAGVTPMSLTSVVNQPMNITAVYGDPDGGTDIKQGKLLVNSDWVNQNGLCVFYDVPNNKLYMFSDDASSFSTGYAPGSNNTISNSQGTLNCAQTTVSTSGNYLTINWNFTPSSTFTGAKKVYQWVTDFQGYQVPWQHKGDWTINTVLAGLTPGLQASYWANQTLTGNPVIKPIVPNIDFNWGQAQGQDGLPGSPDTSISYDHWSARYEGYIEAPFTGQVEFELVVPFKPDFTLQDSSRLWINGQLVIDDWTTHNDATHIGRINMVQGQRYPIICEYAEESVIAAVTLKWGQPGAQLTVVPDSAYSHLAGNFGPPTNLRATAASGSVTLNWDAAPQADKYAVYRALSAQGPWSQVSQVTGTTLTLTDTGLDNGTQYFYSVTSLTLRPTLPDPYKRDPQTNQPLPTGPTYDESTRSEIVSAVPAASLSAPINLTAQGRLARAILKWNAAGGATSYEVARQTGGSGPWQVLAVVTGLSYTDNAINTGVVYRYVVRSRQGALVSGDSNIAIVVPIVPVAAPTSLTATAGNAMVTLNWVASTGATSYLIERSTQAGGPYVLLERTSSVKYIDTEVANGQTYYYIVRGTSIPGGGPAGTSDAVSTPSNEAGATPVARPMTPLQLKAISGHTKIKLEWGGSDEAVSYQIWRSTAGAAWTQIATVPVNTEFYIDSGLTNGVVHTYLVRAINQSGSSQDSNRVTARAQAVLPLQPDVPGVGARTTTSIEIVMPDLPFNANSMRLEMSNGYYSSNEFFAVQSGLTGNSIYIVTGLTAGAEYNFRAVAIGTNGETVGNSVYARTRYLPPATPGAPSYTKVADTSVVIVGSPTPGTYYLRLQRNTAVSPAPDNWQDVMANNTAVTVPASGPTILVSGLTANTTYSFRWVAVGNFGTQGGGSGPTTEGETPGPSSNVTTAPAAPAAPVIEAITTTGMRAQRVATGVTVPALPAGATSLSLEQVYSGSNGYQTFTEAKTLATGLTGNAVYTLSGLWPGTYVTLRYVAVGAAGSTPGPTYSTSTSTGTPPATPTAPVVNNIQQTSLRVQKPNTYNPGGPNDPWVLQQLNGATYADVATYEDYDFTDVSSLTANTSYTFRFRIGTNYGPTVTVVTAPATPAAPTVGTKTDTSVALTLPTVGSGITLTLQRMPYGNTANDDLWSTVSTGLASAATTTVTGLAPSTQHYFRVVAVGPNASTKGSVTPLVTLLDPVPPTPAAPIAKSTGPTSILVSIGAAPQYATTTYVQYKLSTGSSWTDVQANSFPASVTISGLTAATTYDLRIKAVGNNGTATSATTSIMTGPAAPPTPSQNMGATTQTTLTFNVPSTLPAGATSLNLEFGSGSSWKAVATGVTPAQTQIVVAKPTDGSIPSARWVSVGPSGQTPGSYTFVSMGSITPAAPGAPQFSDLGDTSVNVWPSTPVASNPMSSSYPLSLEYKPSSSTTWISLGYVTSNSGAYDPTSVNGLTPGATYDFRYVLSTNIFGAVGSVTMPSPASANWLVGSGISCSGIRYPMVGMKIQDGTLGHFNAFHANDWDLMQRTFHGLTTVKSVTDTCSYSWTAKIGGTNAGTFPDGATGPNVPWLAPVVTVPTTVTLTLTVIDQSGLNKGAADTGNRGDTGQGAPDQPLHFTRTITVLP